MSAPNRARDEVAIVGYAQSPVVRHADRSLGALTLDTARAAIADAGLTPDQVDGFVTASLFPTSGEHAVVDGVSVVSADWLAARLNPNPRYAANFSGLGQIPGSMAMAVNAVASGAAEHVLVHRALHNPAGSYHGTRAAEFRGGLQWTAPQGFFGPLAMIGLTYNEYVQRYGASREALAEVVVEARKNGARLPWSHWSGRPLTAEQYLAEPMLADPIGRFDCDIPVDGAAAFVLTTAERARDLPHRPVHVSGYASGAPPRRRLPAHWPLDDIMAAGTEMADRLWAAAGMGLDEIDLLQVYDGFSPLVFLWLEALGRCPVGEGHHYVRDGGIDSDRPGADPVLLSGGSLGNGRMHGVPQLLECYLQVSGRAGERQRDGVTTALSCHSSPHLGGALVYSAHPQPATHHDPRT
ncbi:thiolase family protein [Blastococcus sp. URHD0036]|uniref:thiolase family protein n=1 Tax=Blastococcus sp. URHD0036 TaxID=1380356 RepID=UPI000495DC40|nr:thiolase family protein [Blastococcus sp. URHD0036]